MVSVIICTHNRAESLKHTLESLSEMDVPRELEWELIVVDNKSTDTTRAVVEEFARRSPFAVRYVFEPNAGVSYARNTAVTRARGGIIAFTDDDVIVTTEWLREIAAAFRQFDCAGVGGRSIPLWGELERPRWLGSPGPYYLGTGPLLDFDQGPEAKLIKTPPYGLNMAFRKSMFEKYGLFRTDLGRVGTGGGLMNADVEFGQRLIRAGEKIAYTPAAVVYHPVHKERLTRGYFLSFYFRVGRSCARTEQLPSGLVRWFGVPRTFYRSLLVRSWPWLTSFRSSERFYHKAQVCVHLGRIAEARKLRVESEAVETLKGLPGDSAAGPASASLANGRAFEETLRTVIEECVAASGRRSSADAARRPEPADWDRD